MTSPEYRDELVGMMKHLYDEDTPAFPAKPSHFPTTVEYLLQNPSAGQIILFTGEGALLGYALLIPYWSNEFGGVLLYVDELYVSPESRRQGIGRSFFLHLERTRPFDAVAIALEVSPTNNGARRLYEVLGFVQRRNALLVHAVGLP